MTNRQPLRSEPTWEEKFEEFHKNNPHVYRWLRDQAFIMKENGRKRYSIKTMIGVLRFRHDISTVSDDFKINDAFTSLYARKIMAENPELDGFFETRQRRAA